MSRQLDDLTGPGLDKIVDEPDIKATIITPVRYLGTVMELRRERRGVDARISCLATGRTETAGGDRRRDSLPQIPGETTRGLDGNRFVVVG